MKRNKGNRRRRQPRDWSAALRRSARVARSVFVAAVFVALGWGLVTLLDRPVSRVSIEGSFERVTAGRLEGVVRDFLPAGVLSADLDAMRTALRAVEWIDRVSVERRWPDELRVAVTEQVPAARWGEHGLLNVRGELFVRRARHVPVELPRLDGPDGSEWEVAQRYLSVRDRLLRAGLGLSALTLDARGSWHAELSNGIEVRLGREDSDRRIERFVEVVVPLIAARAAQVAYVDMRYSNGFAIGWQNAEASGDA